jgi:hypothetical protein
VQDLGRGRVRKVLMWRMGKLYEGLEETLEDCLRAQHVFFVGTAPLGADGHVNVSPKGLDGFRVLGPKRVAYLDHPGSGIETVAHLRENGRIVLMFCAFDGPPKIVRLYGRGRTIEPQDAEFPALLAHFTPKVVPRAIIDVDVERIADSCGFGVPTYEYRGEREQLVDWADKKGPEVEAYQREKNATSIDGLPGLRWVEKT